MRIVLGTGGRTRIATFRDRIGRSKRIRKIRIYRIRKRRRF